MNPHHDPATVTIQSDLFGRHKPHRRIGKRRHTEVFELGSDLSSPERKVVANWLNEKADAYGDNFLSSRQRDKLRVEADRYERCGKDGIGFACPECGAQYYTRTFCKSRICERCARIYVKQLKPSIERAVGQLTSRRKKGYLLGLLTLTVTSKRFGNDLPDSEALKRLYSETSKFLRLYYGKYKGQWTKTEKIRENRKRFIGAGWVAVLEVGKDNNNAHCHCLVYGPYRSQSSMKADWQKITGDSWGVDIRPIRNPREATAYVLKYITKPCPTDSYARLADYSVMIKGCRRLRSGGTLFNRFKIVKRKRDDWHGLMCLFCPRKLHPDGIHALENCLEARIDINAGWRQLQEGTLDIEKIDAPPGGEALPLTLPI